MAFLRTTRQFPQEIQQLTLELDKAYLDIANVVNNRIIGMFPTNRPAVTGESYYLVANQKQQTLRQVFTFTSTSAINHGITVTDPNQFASCFGSYTDGTNSFGLIFGTSVAIAGQISFYVTSTQIVFVLGAGAPALTRGRIVLSWLSSP
jgi:hypothetical protein